jgi:GTP-binding protein
VADAYRTVRRELKAYGADLDKKKEIVALSKCDALDKDTISERLAALQKAARKKPLVLSAVSGLGIKDALYALSREIGRAGEKDDADVEMEHKPWQP